ncbi:hypothetical protein MHTCC0001_35250 [Flavobacteriaceae bacterium MHTCC 0001]
MKKFTVPCIFGDSKHPFDCYIANQVADDSYPLKFQSLWLLEERGGLFPEEVLSAFNKLYKLSLKNNISFEDLSVYALEEANKEKVNSKESDKNKVLEEDDNIQENNIENSTRAKIELKYNISVILDVYGNENLKKAIEKVNEFSIKSKEVSLQFDEIKNKALSLYFNIENGLTNFEKSIGLRNILINDLLKVSEYIDFESQSIVEENKLGEIIFHIQTDMGVDRAIAFLQLVENAYSKLLTFLKLTIKEINSDIDILSYTEKYRMEIGRIKIASPGIWTFLGALNPLQQLREFLNDKNERQKDLKFRNRQEEQIKDIEIKTKEEQVLALKIENRKRLLENEILENQLIKSKIELLKESGLEDKKLNSLIINLISEPILNMKRFVDSRELVGKVEVREVEKK